MKQKTICIVLLIMVYSLLARNVEQGFIEFKLKIAEDIKNGYDQIFSIDTLFTVDGIGQFELIKDYSAIIGRFKWKSDCEHKGFMFYMTDMEKNKEFLFQFTWDSKLGLSDMYVNGVLLRKENDKFYRPWSPINIDENPVVHSLDSSVSNLVYQPKFYTFREIAKRVPEKLKEKNTECFIKKSDLIDLNIYKRDLIYSNNLSSESDVENWLIEGPAKISFKGNSMIVESESPNPPDAFSGNFNFWCPETFPDSIMIEWEFMPINDFGVCHFFFSALGENGEKITDLSLAERDGHYEQYHSGDLNNYFIIYFSNWNILRTTNFAISSLHKSTPYSFVSHGTKGVDPQKKKFNTIQVYKIKERIMLKIDGEICLDWNDDIKRYGRIYNEGSIGFRQMAEVKARYRNLKVYRISLNN
ncbi:MAG: DUF1961 family protein [Candidatus Delongbacteria bacterium]|nr:DUF1961 family protein [Candidatus Delongbacteria bacterium]MBN2835558.1 DUF1961 family protein [Candidatus Delongbacteria bacterium]